jgi:hypothetical protein
VSPRTRYGKPRTLLEWMELGVVLALLVTVFLILSSLRSRV